MHFTSIATAILLSLCVAWAAIIVWRRPALGLGVLAVGLAIHNAVLMVLVDAGTPTPIVRALQAWKEIILAILVVRIALAAAHGGIPRRSSLRQAVSSMAWPVRILDGIAIAFTGLVILYFVLPLVSSYASGATIAQRLLSLRLLLLIPLLYALGRYIGTGDRDGSRRSVDLVIAAAAGVAVIGLAELWFVRTSHWVDFGVNQFTAWQGFAYRGPGGLPENFFQTTPAGFGLRRMVSTYISPLGIAYTALLVVPLIVGVLVVLQKPRAWTWLAIALVLLSLGLSVTRLAIICLVAEAALWVIVRRGRPAIAAGALALAASGLAFGWYPQVGPLVSFDLADVRPPAGALLIEQTFGRTNSGQVGGSPELPGGAEPDVVSGIVTQQDASIQAHVVALQNGLLHAIEHPFGVGLGSTVPRFGASTGPAESALLGIVGEVGVLGGLLFGSLYGGVVLAGLVGARRLQGRPEAELALLVGVGGIGLAPVVMTSAVWGDFSVTILFWWACGVVVSSVGHLAKADDLDDDLVTGSPAP